MSAKKQITIWDDPNVLVVHLKRFHDFSGQKIHQDIHYTATLELEDYMCPTRRLQQQQQQHPQHQQALNFLAQPRAIQQQQQQRPVPAVYTNNGYRRPGMGVAKFVDRQQMQQQQKAMMHQQAQQHQQLVQKKLAAQQQQPWQPHHEQQQQQPHQQHELAGPSNRTASGVYDLHGVLVHKGFTASSGHYYAYVLGGGPNSQWFCANDSNVYRPQYNEALNQTRDAYMLFYVRRNMKQQADLPVQPEAPAPAAAAPAAASAPVQPSVAAAAQRLKRGSDVMIGPQLPPHLQQKRQRLQEPEQLGAEAMETDEHPAAAAAAAGRIYGPQLPPEYQAAGAAGTAAAAAACADAGVSATTAADVVLAAAEPLPADSVAEQDLRPAAAAPRWPAAAAAARAAEARTAAVSAGVRPVDSSSSSGTVLRNGLGPARGGFSARQAGLIPLPAATPATPAAPAAVGVKAEQPAALADYLPDYADEEDEEGEVAATPVQPGQQQHKHEPVQLQQRLQQQAETNVSGISNAAGGGGSSSSAPSSSLGVEPAQIASKLAAELAGRPDCFKQPLVNMLQVYRDQGKSWRQVKPMLLMMLRQSAAVKEAADSVFAPFLKMAQTALSACL